MITWGVRYWDLWWLGIEPCTSRLEGRNGIAKPEELAPLTSEQWQTPRQLFLIEDMFTLGHMQMSFAALFSHLVSLPAGAELLVSFVHSAAREYPGWRGVVSLYYFPLLKSLVKYAAKHRGIILRVLRSTDPLYYAWKQASEPLFLINANGWRRRTGNQTTAGITLFDEHLSSNKLDLMAHPPAARATFNVSVAPWCFGSIVRRRCPRWGLSLPADAAGRALAGHCAAFFASAQVVRTWRHFLASSYQMRSVWLTTSQASQQASPKT